MANKVTKRDYYAILADVVANSETDETVKIELTEFINREIELLNRKHNSTSAPTKTQRENEAFKVAIMEWAREYGAPFRSKEVAAQFEGWTTQKATALLRLLINSNELTKTTDKGITTYTVVVSE